jgi:membrane-anchored protein YejM (alkaline phosphatase superfamily)
MKKANKNQLKNCAIDLMIALLALVFMLTFMAISSVGVNVITWIVSNAVIAVLLVALVAYRVYLLVKSTRKFGIK